MTDKQRNVQNNKLSQIKHAARADAGENGLYDRAQEHDACGLGFVAHLKNQKSHKIVQDGLKILCNLEHRGAVGADPKAGDGCGILIQMPHTFCQAKAKESGFEIGEELTYAVAPIFLPQDTNRAAKIRNIVEDEATKRGHTFLGWRKVPVDNSGLGYSVKPTEPVIEQAFIEQADDVRDADHFELKLFILRRVIELRVENEGLNEDEFFYIPSMSCRTLVYKGMLLSYQVGEYYKDFADETMISALALVHQRFSTNTFPTWSLAHPYRMIAHNGEINTVRGNINWMAARQATIASPLIGDELDEIWPLIPEGQSDSACFDNALELLLHGGYSLAHAMMILIPEAWAGNDMMDPKRKAFYEYYAALMEPWDGPAAVAFTDGKQIGATLDRNGLRPARYLRTEDDVVMLASEMGVLQFDEESIVEKWRLQPGKMLLIDLEQGHIISDEELKSDLADKNPYGTWLEATQLKVSELPSSNAVAPIPNAPLLDRQQAFGYTQESLKFIIEPMISSSQEAVGSMGTDTPIAPLSNKEKSLHGYFKQNFAQVTNPPIDPIREEIVMSLVSFIGPRPNLLDLEGSSGLKRLEAPQPILSNEELEKIRAIGDVKGNRFRTITLDMCYDAQRGHQAMADAIDSLCEKAADAVNNDFNIVILSDRGVTEERIAIPALLATSAVHHHLIRKGLRTSVGLVVETGEAHEVHNFATLGGYGAEAINPYLAFETINQMADRQDMDLSPAEAHKHYIKAIGKGLLKVMSKMGISTYQSYCGAQIFDAVGLNSQFIKDYFTGTHGKIEGIGLEEIAIETHRRHARAFGNTPYMEQALEVGGEFAVRTRGEAHVWKAPVIADLQHAVRGNLPEKYLSFSQQINEQDKELKTIRGLFHIKSAEEAGRPPIELAEVEPASEIVKRFATGAMSYGSISREAHTTLAIAMNRIGGKSNTGEGGEHRDRFTPKPNGDSERSAIKQVASGRFGVTGEYLSNADMIQIKMAQGAKPGEGGQLPGAKVDDIIAGLRHSTPGVGLISPPPHHDIYSIEDLAQLIYDLKNVNSRADISVKLVSELGVGTVAAGVAKAKADHITISGFEGGTGAAALTSIKHAGSPWEIGLAETQQTLVLNELRSRVVVQVDGGLRTGRDVIVGALLGADEFGFATAPLIAAGCLMMRKCHLNTCPVGIATQNKELRKRFNGLPEHVVNYFFFVAEEVRTLMAQMGVAKLDDIIGHADLLEKNTAIAHWKAQGLDFSRLFHRPKMDRDTAIRNTEPQVHAIADILDRKLISDAKDALEHKTPVKIDRTICNVDRSAGAMLGGTIAAKYGHEGLDEDTIWITLKGIAGQSFGAWSAKGTTLDLIGEGNDYVGKGLSGGKIIVRPPVESGIVPQNSIIVGNTVLYGAITGQAYLRGVAGERFAVRNSGAYAIVEGTGDHGCEYMTGGVVTVLGKTGRNFAAGMSGGIAYVYDEDGQFERRCNKSMVDLEPVSMGSFTPSPQSERQDLSLVMQNMLADDAARLYQMILHHKHYTGSQKAADILDNFEEGLSKFVKVTPREYRRALSQMAGQDKQSNKQTVNI